MRRISDPPNNIVCVDLFYSSPACMNREKEEEEEGGASFFSVFLIFTPLAYDVKTTTRN